MTSPVQFPKLAALGLIAVTTAVALSATQPQPIQAQGSGLTIFGGVEVEYRLPYYIDFNYPHNTNSRYYLNVQRTKLPRDVIAIEVEYPESFTEIGGRIDPNDIQLRTGEWRGQDQIPIKVIEWYEDENRFEIIPAEPIPANTNLVLVMSDVNNPRRYGYHYFNLRMMFQGDVIDQYVGTWPLELAADSPQGR